MSSITLNQAFEYIRIIERGLFRLGIVSRGGLVELERLIKKLEKLEKEKS